DPGLVAQVLRDSPVWRAMFGAWRAGAVLAGSSAGSMALCSHTLVRATWPNRFRRRAVEALGAVPHTAVLTHYDTFGPNWVHGGRGRPVLFIHGLGSSGYMEWRFNLEPTATRHRVYAPDLPGYGRTGKPKVRYTIGYFARFIERYMENRGLGSAVIIGASLG